MPPTESTKAKLLIGTALIAVFAILLCGCQKDATLQGDWSCANDRQDIASKIHFNADGALVWVDEPGKITEQHRIGRYAQKQDNINITLNRLWGPTIDRNVDVSIDEGVKIETLSLSNLKMIWWQSSHPNDRVTITCKR